VGLDLRNCDCMELMKEFPDKHFDLAIVDPPYGIGFDREYLSMSTSKTGFGGKVGNRIKAKGYKQKQWDNSKPDDKYFNELYRVSKKQIIWGGNYFNLPSSGGWIVWDKKRPEDFTLSMGELAWVSWTNSLRIFYYRWSGMLQEKSGDKKEERNHPTQKPVDLYKWILKTYANEGFKILDTHLGSGSIAIACHDYKFDLVASEIDKEYFDSTMKRVSNHLAQTVLF